MERVDNGTQAIQRCLRILDCFSIEEPQLPLARIAAQAQLATSTTHRILKALQANEFVLQDRSTGTYELGSAIMRLARVILHGNGQEQLVRLAMPVMRHLRNETNETAVLYVRSHETRVCLAEVSSQQRIRTATAVGLNYPLFLGAAGKAILAFLTPSEIESIIAIPLDKGELTSDGKDKLLKDLDGVRTRGYATSFNEVENGISGVAAPVFWATDEVLAAITITAPGDRLAKEDVKDIAKKLTEATTSLSYQLGASVHGDSHGQ